MTPLVETHARCSAQRGALHPWMDTDVAYRVVGSSQREAPQKCTVLVGSGIPITVRIRDSTAANVNDVTQAGKPLHGEETDALGDAGYRALDKREEAQGPQWHIAMQPGKRKQLSDSALGQMPEKVEKLKSSIRAKVEHPFHIIKYLFRHNNTRYLGLPKYHPQMYSLFGLTNPHDGQAAVIGDSLRRCVLNARKGPARGKNRTQKGKGAGGFECSALEAITPKLGNCQSGRQSVNT